jgi:hypothetical protein
MAQRVSTFFAKLPRALVRAVTELINRTVQSRTWLVVSAILSTHLATAAMADALPDHDNGPLTGIFGLPDSREDSDVLARHQHAWDLSVATSSHNIDETAADEILRLDGETTRLAIRYQRGLTDNLDIGIEVPYLWHESGNLDSIIEGWHSLFGFPNGARDIRQRDRLDFFYQDSRANTLAQTQNTNGFGDVRFLARWQKTHTETYSSAIQFGVKLPTGDSDNWLGSGGTDISIGLTGDASGLWSRDNLSGFYRLNITYLGEPDWLADRYNDFVGQLSVGLGLQVHRNLELSMQSRIRSPIYDSDIESLGATSVSLTFGANVRIVPRYRLVFSVGEDARPGSAPDVSFQIALVFAGTIRDRS